MTARFLALCRDHAGEGRHDGWIPEAGHHAAGECAEIGVEVSLVGHGYLLRRMLGHEVGQQPIKAAPAPPHEEGEPA